MLEKKLNEVPYELIKRIISGKSKQEYAEALRCFALTLQFYSSKAYAFVRKTFHLALPHPSQIRRWYSVIPADPGFTEPAFKTLEVKASEAEKAGRKVICSLMLDEMAIKKHIAWDGNKFTGYVNIGNGIEDDSKPLAKDALVFMVVCVNASWKIPCGYFFIDGMSGAERANLVNLCIERLFDTGVQVSFIKQLKILHCSYSRK